MLCYLNPNLRKLVIDILPTHHQKRIISDYTTIIIKAQRNRIMFCRPHISIVLACLILLCSTSHAASIEVEDAWVREAPPSARTLAAYMRIINTTAADLSITKIASPSFKKLEIHQTSTTNNMMRMHKVEQATLPARGNLTLEPGGKHLMLFSPKQRFKAGDHVIINLSFSNGSQHEVHAIVKKDNGMSHHKKHNDDSHHHHH